MEEIAVRARQETESLGHGVQLSLPWVDVSYRVGDRIGEIEGRSVAVAGRPGETPRYPKVARVAYDFSSQRTELHLAAPEQGV